MRRRETSCPKKDIVQVELPSLMLVRPRGALARAAVASLLVWNLTVIVRERDAEDD